MRWRRRAAASRPGGEIPGLRWVAYVLFGAVGVLALIALEGSEWGALLYIALGAVVALGLYHLGRRRRPAPRTRAEAAERIQSD